MNYWITLKAIAEIKNRTTLQKQPLHNKIFIRCYTFNSIFIAKNARICINFVVYLLFMLPLRMTANHVFCSTLLAFGMSRPRTPAISKTVPFVTKANNCKSLILLERASSICCLSIYLSICLVCLPVCLPACLPACLPYVCLCIYICIYLCVYLLLGSPLANV